MLKLLATNDDGWDAPGLAALKLLAAEWGELWVVAPRDPHSYAGHRITTDAPLKLVETGCRQFHLSGTPADCVRVALTALEPGIDLVLAGINRGGNLGADLYISGTVAAAREAALLGRRAIAISQYIRKGMTLDWARSGEIARGILGELAQTPPSERSIWTRAAPRESPTAIPITCRSTSAFVGRRTSSTIAGPTRPDRKLRGEMWNCVSAAR